MSAARRTTVEVPAGARPEPATQSQEKKKVTIVLHSGDIDKIYSALIIGTGNLSMGWDASIYFTFWGLERLRKGRLDKAPLSKMNFFGLGSRMIKSRMKAKHVRGLDQLIRDYRELGGKIIACEMTMDVMGIQKDDLDKSLVDEYGAVGTWFKDAKDSGITLFI